jgi:PadR family transcriptional regulator PadR
VIGARAKTTIDGWLFAANQCTIARLCIDCRGMEAEYVRGHLGTMILAVLAAGPAHGYGIGAELKRRSDDQLEVLEGSLYPALHRLEEAGWVDSEWEINEGRRRRSYSLTADGKAELGARGARWTAFRSFMNSLLKDGDA